MTRKDYKLIAQALSDVRPLGFANKSEAQFFNHVVTVLSVYLARDNATFNTAKFLEACFVQRD